MTGAPPDDGGTPLVSYTAKEVLENIRRDIRSYRDETRSAIKDVSDDVDALTRERLPARVADLEGSFTWATRLVIAQFLVIVGIAIVAALKLAGG